MIFKSSLGFLLLQIGLLHRGAMEKLAVETGLHGGQVSMMAHLWETDAVSQAELVRKLGVSPPTVNKMVGLLVKNGFVKCLDCKQDKRLKRVHLTKKGKDVRLKVEQQWHKLETMTLANLSETETMMLSMLLVKVKNSLASGVGES
jgi:MarR family transcriptional regulator, organic hydroperoxide resistance regulator